MTSLEVHQLIDRALAEAAAYTDSRVRHHEEVAVAISGVLAFLVFGLGVLVGVTL